MQLQTTVDTPTYPFSITHHDRLTFIGSCFADNIGQKFSEKKFNALLNPYGVLYNPASISQCIDSILSDEYDESQLIEYQGIWHSFSHHGSFSMPDREQCIAHIKHQRAEAKSHLLDTDYLFITLGSAHTYSYNGNIVSNCHKLPNKLFERRRLTMEETVGTLKKSILKLQQVNPKVKIIFTVSPVRYTKDGMHANSLSKATLLLAVEQLCQLLGCHYLPAYEIVLDELRDYRFFAEDMTHTSHLAINYVWQKIESYYLNESTMQLIRQIQKITAAAAHRPFNTNPAAHQQFLSSLLAKASDLQSKHPEIDLTAEISYFQKK